MADVTIGGIAATLTVLTDADLLEFEQGAASKKGAASVIKNYILSELGDTDVALTADSDLLFATQKATKAYVDAAVGGGVSDGDKGDITVSTDSDGRTLTIDNDAVTYAKMQNVGANSVLARAAGASGDLSEVALAVSELLGRGSTGNVAAIQLGAGLTMIGTELSSDGGNGAAYNDATTFDTFGDSITTKSSSGASDSAHQYGSLIAAARGWTETTHAVSGDGVAEVAIPAFAEVIGDGQQSTLQIGTNDVRTYTTSVPKQEAWKLGHLAIAAWLAIPDAKKVYGQAGSFGGTWANNSVYGATLVKTSEVAASTATYTVYGTVAYVCSLVQNSIVATYSVAIDGVAKGTFSTAPGASITSANGTTYMPALLRFPGLNEGPHTVVITVATASAGNPVYVAWVAGNQAARTKTGPNVWVGNVPRYSAAGYVTYGGSDAVVTAFNEAARDNIRLLAADGLNVGLVDVCAAVNPLTDLGGDGLHPDDSGHEAMAQAYLEAINQIQKPGTVDQFRKVESLLEADTTTAYTFKALDLGKVKTFSNGSAIAGTLPQAGVSFPNGWFADVQNIGAGTLTITPTTSTINGASTLVLTTGQSARIVSDGTNYRALLGSSVGGSGASTTQTGEMMAGYVGTVADKTYKIVVKAAHGGTITETTTISESGTCTATFKINTTALGGTANSVSTSEQSQAQASANVFSAGDDIQITVSSNSTCLGMSFTIKYTRVYS